MHVLSAALPQHAFSLDGEKALPCTAATRTAVERPPMALILGVGADDALIDTRSKQLLFPEQFSHSEYRGENNCAAERGRRQPERSEKKLQRRPTSEDGDRMQSFSLLLARSLRKGKVDK